MLRRGCGGLSVERMYASAVQLDCANMQTMFPTHLFTSKSVSTGICTRSSGLICGWRARGGRQAGQHRWLAHAEAT